MIKKFSVFVLLFTSLLILSACGVTISIDDEHEDAIDIVDDQINDSQDSTTSENLLFPKMILASTQDEYGLTYFDLEGNAITEYKTPGMGYLSASGVHIAGSVSDDLSTVPLVYHSFGPPESLLMNINDIVSTVTELSNFTSLAGARGEDLIAYSIFGPSAEQISVELFVGELNSLSNTGPVLSFIDIENYFALSPLAVKTENGIGIGVWYTRSAWGIGGDIVYPINRGLYYLDLLTGDNLQYEDDDCNVQGLSPDMNFASCRRGAGTGTASLTIENLATNDQVEISVDPSNDRGAGYGVFSPDNNNIAWLEASGSQMAEVPDFHSRIKIGFANGGGVVFDQDDITLAQMLGESNIPYMKPIGWLNNQTLLIEVRTDDWDKALLATIDVMTGVVSRLLDGAFIDFGY